MPPLVTVEEELITLGALSGGLEPGPDRADVLQRPEASEVLALLPRDVDLEGGEVNVRRGKGGRQRLAGLNAAAQAHLTRWMERRAKLGATARQPVFCTFSRVAGERQVGPLQPRYVQLMLKRLAGRAGIDKRVHPHGFRHSLKWSRRADSNR